MSHAYGSLALRLYAVEPGYEASAMAIKKLL